MKKIICLLLGFTAYAAATYAQENQLPKDEFIAGQTVKDGAVTIRCDKNNYYDVTIDMRDGATPYETGVSYGKCVKQLPLTYEYRLMCFMGGCIAGEKLTNEEIGSRIADILPNIDRKYVEMMNGFALQLTSSAQMPVPATMVYAANLLQDVVRPTSCSGFGVMPKASESGKTIVYRTLDWPPIPAKAVDPKTFITPERGDLMSPLQAVTRIIYPKHSIVYFGCLGTFQCITGINTATGVMAGILDADTGGKYDSKGSRSYGFDLRSALEECGTSDEIAAYMADTSRYYAYSHLILLGDKKQVRVLENNCTKLGEKPQRALRSASSELANHIPVWNFPNVIGIVNSYMLPGQPDSFRASVNDHNSGRWDLLIEGCNRILAQKKKFSENDVMDIMCSYKEQAPRDHSDMYRRWTQQMMLYVPAEKKVKVFYKPFDGKVFAAPDKVQEHFFEITL